MTRIPAQIAIIAATTVTAQNCFWRSYSQIRALSDWYPCNSTRANEDGARLCCLANSQCGQDSICLGDNNYYVGGCTDGTYGDAVCRTSCTEDGQTFIQWNPNTQAWECCGSHGCDGSPPTETFTAVARASWSPIEWVKQASSASSSTASTTSGPSSSSETTAPSSTSTAQASSSSTNDPTPQPSGDTDKARNLSTGAQAGIGVACGVLGLAAILALALVLMKKRKNKARRASRSELQGGHITRDPDFSDDQGAAALVMSQKHVPLVELNAQQPQQPKQEMPAGPVDPVELESGGNARGLR